MTNLHSIGQSNHQTTTELKDLRLPKTLDYKLAGFSALGTRGDLMGGDLRAGGVGVMAKVTSFLTGFNLRSAGSRDFFFSGVGGRDSIF